MLLFLFLSFKELVCCSACIAWTVGAASGLAQALAQAAGTLYQRPVRSSESAARRDGSACGAGVVGCGAWTLNIVWVHIEQRLEQLYFRTSAVCASAKGLPGPLCVLVLVKCAQIWDLRRTVLCFWGESWGGGSSKLRVARCKNAIRCSICGKRRRASAC